MRRESYCLELRPANARRVDFWPGGALGRPARSSTSAPESTWPWFATSPHAAAVIADACRRHREGKRRKRFRSTNTIRACSRRIASASPSSFRTQRCRCRRWISNATLPTGRRYGTSTEFEPQRTQSSCSSGWRACTKPSHFRSPARSLPPATLVVLERPQPAYAAQIVAAAGPRAIVYDASRSRNRRSVYRRTRDRVDDRPSLCRGRRSTTCSRSVTRSSYGLVAAGLVGAVQPRGLAAPAFFCSLAGIVAALQQGPGRLPHLDLCEQSAPLFGRELARAKALVSCSIAVIAAAAYCATASLAGWREIPFVFAATLAAAIPSTLTALCATLRAGSPRRLYLAMAPPRARSSS